MLVRRVISFIALAVLGIGVAPTVAADGLDAAIDQALERVSRAGRDPLVLEDPRAPEEELESREHLAIARSIRAIEDRIDSTRVILDGDVTLLLSLARQYRQLGMRERALVWYDRADLADHTGEVVDVIEEERSACIAEIGDSTRIFVAIDELLARDDPQTWSYAVEPLMEAALAYPRAVELSRQLAEIDAMASPVDGGLLWRVGQLRMERGEYAAARKTFVRILLAQDDQPVTQVAAALKGLADSSLLLGDHDRAASLYRRYRKANAGLLSAWATYQLGALAAIEGNHSQAADLFRSVCDRADQTPWSEDACTRLRLTQALIERVAPSAQEAK